MAHRIGRRETISTDPRRTLSIEDLATLKTQIPDTRREDCEAKGGKWDAENEKCILKEVAPAPQKQAPRVQPRGVEIIKDQDTGKISGIRTPDGRTIFGSPKEIRALAAKFTKDIALPPGTQAAGTTQRAADVSFTQEQLAVEGQRLAGQVGQIDPSTGITPTDLSERTALIVGVRDAIPRALSLAGGAAVLGGTVGLATGGTASIPLAIGGAAATFVGSISSSMISNMRSQRVDNTNAQQRVLDEGKQTLNDWVTLAGADPAKREFYLTQFNIQLQLIQDAHVQMLTDTNADVAKFENSITNLAEFNSFYSEGGERDALVQDMRVSLATPATPEYAMIELTARRKRD